MSCGYLVRRARKNWIDGGNIKMEKGTNQPGSTARGIRYRILSNTPIWTIKTKLNASLFAFQFYLAASKIFVYIKFTLIVRIRNQSGYFGWLSKQQSNWINIVQIIKKTRFGAYSNNQCPAALAFPADWTQLSVLYSVPINVGQIENGIGNAKMDEWGNGICANGWMDRNCGGLPEWPFGIYFFKAKRVAYQQPSWK